MRDEADQPRQKTETDPRFPSGPWLGLWMQRGWGEQKIRLSRWFVDGGTDMVGKFTFDGTYDLKSGRCLMTKQYENAHRLIYDGANQDDGMWLWGLWQMGHTRGGFHLWPEGEENPTQRRTAVEDEEPVEPERQEVLIAP